MTIGGPTREEKLAALKRKGTIMLVLLAVAVLVLVGRLAMLQVQNGRHYLTLAQGERIRIVHLPAPRGKILDSHGLPLATNRPSFTASLVYTGNRMSAQEVALLSRILGIDPNIIRKADAQLLQGVPYTPVRLKSDLTPQQSTLLDEQRSLLPGVVVQPEPMRTYPGLGDKQPGQDLAANVLGYIGRGNTPIEVVGKAGVERSFNGPLDLGGRKFLGLEGKQGIEQVEVDALGHPVRYAGGQPPQPGNNVVLTLNAHLQDVAQRALAQNLADLRTHHFFDGGPFPATQGAVVAIDPRSGRILALASQPTYNPNDFARSVYDLPGSPGWKAWQREYAALASGKAPGHPLVDHAISDLSAPGSTFKPITALAALLGKVITPDQRISCPPYIQVGPERKHNWVRAGGILNLYQAIGRSCDTYFYQVGERTGIQRIEAMARQFGLGQPTGQRALAGEEPGFVAGPDTQRKLGYKRPWNVSDTMDAAIGQGFNSFNVLEMANYVATLANGGTRYRPYLISSVQSPSGPVLWANHPQVVGHVNVPAADFAVIRQAMVDVTQYHRSWIGQADAPFGTAYVAFQDWPALSKKYTGHVIPVAAKTGTAEQTGQVPNGWFICFAPADHPTIAIAVYVREGDEGVLSGAPVARDILSAYFGIPNFIVAGPNW